MSTSEVQSVILSKDVYTSLASAKAKIREMGFHRLGVDEKEHTWRFRQREPTEFDHFILKHGKDGVSLIIGFYH